MKKIYTLCLMLAFGITSVITAQTCNDLSSSSNEGFEGGVGSFTVVDNNGGSSWSLSSLSNSGDSCLRYAYDNTLPGDDIAFSECLDLQIGETYNVSFYVRAYNTTGEKMRVVLSNDTTFSSIVDTLLDYDPVPYSNWTMVSHNFTVTAAGNHHIGFHAYSAPYEWWLYLDDISITKLNPAEAGLIALSSSAGDACSLSASETASVEFVNNGTDSISSIDIELDVNGISNIETYVATPAIAPGDTASYTFTNTMDMSAQNAYNITATLMLNGDSDSSNNSMTKTVNHFGSTGDSASYTVSTPLADKDITNFHLTFCGLPSSIDSCFKIHSLTIDSLEHTWLSDLEIYLISPSSDTLEITTDNGGMADDLINVVFSDTANTNISSMSSGIASGYYHPEDSMGFAKFNGTNPNGTWTLQVGDDGAGDLGTMYSWTLMFDNCVITSQDMINSNAMVNIYPNPAKDYVIIDLVDESQVSVYNISGQLVHAFEANTQSIVNTKDWTQGIYFINIQSNNGNIQQKIVVE